MDNIALRYIQLTPAPTPGTPPKFDIVFLPKEVYPTGEIPFDVVKQHVAPEDALVEVAYHFFSDPNIIILCDEECRLKANMKPTLMTQHRQYVLLGPVIVCATQDTEDGAVFRGLTEAEYRIAMATIRPLGWRE